MNRLPKPPARVKRVPRPRAAPPAPVSDLTPQAQVEELQKLLPGLDLAVAKVQAARARVVAEIERLQRKGLH